MRRRNSLRLPEYDYHSAGAYFVTVCSRNRACLFGEIVEGRMRLNRTGQIVETCWRRIPSHLPSVTLDAFIVMPNHVHGIVLLNDRATQVSPVRLVVGAFKACASRNAGVPPWQRGYFDRIIRDEPELALARRYVADNPLKWAIDLKRQPRLL